jgi:protein ImuA
LRRWRRQSEAGDFGQPTASSTRWRVSVLPSAPLPVPGLGRARWLVELIRAKAGESADFEVEACDAKGRIALPSEMVGRPPQKEVWRRIASA